MAFVEAGRASEAWDLFDMINPVRHASTPDEVAVYRVEPYVAAADVYAVAPHVGRGGWTWYTGSAGWLYRLIIESLLGIRREGGRLRVVPKLPAHWPGFRFRYRFGASVHRIEVIADAAAAETPNGHVIDLVDDGAEHVHTLRVRPCSASEAHSAGVKNPRTSAS
jgi:cyclic beta-1,2-glucan synthetase